MIKVAITANTSWYLYNFRKNTVLALLEQGFFVTAIAPEDEYSSKLSELGATFLPLKMDQGGTNPIKDSITMWNMFKIYREQKFDVVLNFTPKNNIYSTIAAKLNGSKVINNIAGLGMIFINENMTAKIARVLYKISQSKADRIFFQNEEDRKLFLDNKLAKEEITDRLMGSGVDLERFTPVQKKNDGVVRFLLVARMLFDKGVGQYVESARLLKEKYGDKVEFRLLGFLDCNNPSAISTDQMNEWVNEGVVNYLGTSDSVETEISKIDCMVLPSFYREGVPRCLLEAGAMAKPIVTTDNVGCRETVNNGVSGFLCEPRSTESLSLSLEKVIQMSHEERLLMGLASRHKIESEFDEKLGIQKYIDTIKSITTETHIETVAVA